MSCRPCRKRSSIVLMSCVKIPIAILQCSGVLQTFRRRKRFQTAIVPCFSRVLQNHKPRSIFQPVPPRLNVKTDGRQGFEIIDPSLISACAFKMRIVRRASLVARSADRPVKQEVTPAKVVFYYAFEDGKNGTVAGLERKLN